MAEIAVRPFLKNDLVQLPKVVVGYATSEKYTIHNDGLRLLAGETLGRVIQRSQPPLPI